MSAWRAKRSARPQNYTATAITAARAAYCLKRGQGIVSGCDTNITGPSKEQIEQIQKPLAEQLSQKDTQIAALTKMLLEKNPEAGPGAQQAVGETVGSIVQGAESSNERKKVEVRFAWRALLFEL
jgi:hypothetical protein